MSSLLLDIAPQELDGSVIRRVAGQLKDGQPVRVGGEELPGGLGRGIACAILNQNQRSSRVFQP
jgi:hypothetical protein